MAFPALYRGDFYWIESQPKQGGRLVLMRSGADGNETCVTPAGYNVRTRVHEYGGRCYVLGNARAYFSNFSDQRLYAHNLDDGAVPVPLTPARFEDDSRGMYADLQITPDRRHLLFVWERGFEDRENRSVIGTLRVSADSEQVPEVLLEGSDFYANPAIEPSGGKLAWIQWRHPDMPWDQSELWLGTLVERGDRIAVTESLRVAGGRGRSVCQAAFADDGSLYFAMDSDDPEQGPSAFWNLHRYRDGTVSAVTCDTAEYGAPHWLFGESRYAPLSAGRLLASRTSALGDELLLLDTATGARDRLAPELLGFAHFSRAGGSDDVVLVGRSATRGAALFRYRGSHRQLVQCKAVDPVLEDADISVAESIEYPTRDGATAFAYFYAPKNAHYRSSPATRPPLLVMVHGGPTSRCLPTLDVSKQFWTTRGFAILDVNHRGSTGHGRTYRQALLGHWGEYEVSDIVDGIDYLKQQGAIDPNMVCIRGRSAGGYTVLQALTQFPDYFNAGACYYGIGNLATLANTTHKFEMHYTDGLLGEVFDKKRACRDDSLYYRRSPVHHLHRLKSPMIVFQGLDDKVVPPSLSRELVSVLKERGIEHEYVEYPGEGHGFRSSETNVDALTRETNFYIRVLRLGRC